MSIRAPLLVTLLFTILVLVGTAAAQQRAITDGSVDGGGDGPAGYSTRQLRAYLENRDAACHGCLERADLVERALQVEHAPTIDDGIAAQVTADAGDSITMQMNPPEPVLPALAVYENDRLCQRPLTNGTMHCQSWELTKATMDTAANQKIFSASK
jgi:hypothetical protein